MGKNLEKPPDSGNLKRFSRRDIILGVPAVILANRVGKRMAESPDSDGIAVAEKKIITQDSGPKKIFEDPKSARKAFEGSEALSVFLRSAKEKFLNIGVAHVDNLLENQLNNTPLGEAIRSADVVCLEWSNKGTYFANIADLKKDGTVVNFAKNFNYFGHCSTAR